MSTTAPKLSARVRVSAVNGWLMSWMVFWYVTVQLPFAVLSTAGLGMAAAVYTVVARFTPDSGFLTGVIDATVGLEVFRDVASAVLSVALRFFGLSFDPLLLFLIPFALVFGLGLLQLMGAWFVYALCGLNPLSGRASTAKNGMFLLALLGTCVPVLNLFPLTLLWCVVVWLYPK